MTTAVQHRRGTTAEHATFTGLEGEVTIDTTKDTAVIHDGILAGGYPLAKETLANVNPSTLGAITGSATASDDLFLVFDTSTLTMKKITRAELNNAMEVDALANVTITGGTINGTTIGATNAASGRFTSITNTDGTANGVTYLNGSKVLTSGSALTFDGTNLGVGTSTPDALFNVHQSATSGTDSFIGSFTTASGGLFRIACSDLSQANPVWQIRTGAGEAVAFNNGGTENMRIDPLGNVGIGTSSPGALLDVSSTAPTIRITNTSDKTWVAGDEIGRIEFYSKDSSTPNGTKVTSFIKSISDVGSSVESGALTFGTSVGGGASVPAVERLRLDSAGNLGLGVTPSAWASPFTASFQQGSIGGVSITSSGAGDARFYANAQYLSGTGWTYGATTYASGYRQNAGQHQFFTAPSGTAGAAISFTQAMTLSAIGDLSIGTTVTPAQLWLSSSSSTVGVAARATGYLVAARDSDYALQLNRITTDGDIAVFRKNGTVVGSIGNTGSRLYLGSGDVGAAFQSDVDKRFYPVDPSNGGAGKDAYIDLGRNNVRWKDLYLSGKITNNGTGGINIDTSGNVGIGTSSPAAKLDIVGSGDVVKITSSAQNLRYFITDGTITARLGVDAEDCAYVGTQSNHAFKIRTNGANIATFSSSGNLGLGVTPSAWQTGLSALDINGRGGLAYLATPGQFLALSNNAYYNAGYKYKASAGAGQMNIGNDGSFNWLTAPSGTAGAAISFTQAMTLDASGRLLVGTTSASNSQVDIVDSTGYNNRALTIARSSTDAASKSSAISIRSWSNAEEPVMLIGAGIDDNTSNSLRIGGGFSNLNSATSIAFYTAANNTTLTGTERLRIDASGNVGIGTSSPATNLDVSTSSGNTFIRSITTSTTGTALIQAAGDSTQTVVLRTWGTANAGALFGQTLSGWSGLYSEGAASNGLIVGTFTSKPLLFGTANTERARIDSSGNLLVGATSNSLLPYGRSAKFVSSTSENLKWASTFGTTATSGTVYGISVIHKGYSPNSTGSEFFVAEDSVAVRATIRSNGGIANYSANNVNLSDRREKTNFAPAKSYLETICAIPVQTFNYIDQNLEEDDGLTLGVVAQDVQAVAPELVMESNWGTEDEPKMRLSVYQTDLQYALMKCIQEQQAIIESLTARVSALEGN